MDCLEGVNAINLKLRKLYSSDQDLIEDCLAGKRQAQYELYQRFSPSIYPTCIRYVGNENDATEVLANVFIKVFEKLSQFKQEGSFDGWIRTIAVRESLNYIKARNRYILTDNAEQIGEDYSDDSLSENLDASELLALIQALPDGYRTVFNMYAIEGYSHKEIANQLGISESTSKTQLFKARQKLKEQVIQLENQQQQK